MTPQPDHSLTLIMLLSMSKLAKGHEQAETNFSKRWQTPADVLEQAQEVVHYFSRNNRNVTQIVNLYTNTLYLNDDKPAIALHEKYSDLTSDHKRKTQKIFLHNNLPHSVVLWDELLQAQTNTQQARILLKNAYKNNADFRHAVQMDNLKRHDSVLEQNDVVLPSDMFVLEEAGILSGLAKGYVVHDKINRLNHVVIAYPGPPLTSLCLLLDNKSGLHVHKGRPLHKPVAHFSALDVSVPNKPVEMLLYQRC